MLVDNGGGKQLVKKSNYLLKQPVTDIENDTRYSITTNHKKLKQIKSIENTDIKLVSHLLND